MDSREMIYPRYMVFACSIAVLTSLSIGYVIGSPNVPEKAIRGIEGACGPDPYTKVNGFYNCFYFADLLWGFCVGCFCLGALAGGLCADKIQTTYGRRMTMLIANIFFIVGALLIGFTQHQAQFAVGRAVAGVGCGLGGVVVPTYIGEVATVKSRGALGACYQLLLVVGILISNAIGLGLSYPPKWRVCLVLLAVPAIIQFLLLPSLAESPKWLITQGRAAEARESLQRLREDANIDAEFNDIIRVLLKDSIEGNADEASAEKAYVGKADEASAEKAYGENVDVVPIIEDGSGAGDFKVHPVPSQKYDLSNYRPPKNYSVMYLFFKSECRGLAMLCVILHFFQQASGMNGLIYFSTTFLESAFGKDKTKYLTVGTSAANLVATIASVYLIERLGRKTLLLISAGGCCIFAVVLFSGSYADVGDLVVIAVFMFIVSFALGLGPIPWLYTSELLPSYALSPATSIATSVNWGMNFVISFIFGTLTTAMGSGTFILFAAVCGACFLFVLIFLPETKGRTVEEILTDRGIGPRSDM